MVLSSRTVGSKSVHAKEFKKSLAMGGEAPGGARKSRLSLENLTSTKGNVVVIIPTLPLYHATLAAPAGTRRRVRCEHSATIARRVMSMYVLRCSSRQPGDTNEVVTYLNDPDADGALDSFFPSSLKCLDKFLPALRKSGGKDPAVRSLHVLLCAW